MSDFPKPSAPAGISGPVDLVFPRGMFFNALDYAPGASVKAKPTPSQVNVSRARSQAVAELTRLKDRLGSSLAHLRTADEYGQVTASMDVLVSVADDVHDAVLKLAKAADNAEARYEQHFEGGADAAAEEPAA